jgi:hypothetical protein
LAGQAGRHELIAVFRVGPELQRNANKLDYFAPADWKTLDAHKMAPKPRSGARHPV